MSSQDSRWCRWGWFGLSALVLIWGASAVGTFPLESRAAEAEAPAAAGEAAPAGAGGGTAAKPEQKNYLMWIIESSGLIGLVIFCLSIYFVATVAKLFFELRLPMVVPPEVVDESNSLLEANEFKGIYDLVKGDESFFSRVLSTGITDLQHGLAEARESMERVGDALTVEMEKKISMLAVLGTLGPMIGLLGTLKGMIASFSVIALSDVQLKASEVAGGISEALLLTFEGVGLSVPAIYFFAFFRNRVTSISTAAMLEADQFIRHFAHAGKSRQAGAAPAAAAQPARP